MRLKPGPVLLLPLLFFTVMTLSAQNSVEYLEGEVLIQRNGNELEADFGTLLEEGDIIQTLEGSLAILELEGGRVLKMKDNSSLRLEDLSSNTSLELRKGGVFSKVDHIVNGRFEIRTESVVAGVRGTEFFVSFGKAVEDSADIWLCVNDGTVEVIVPGTGNSVLVNEGEGINILGGKELTDPERYEWTRDLNWNTDPSAGDVKDATNLEGAYADLLDQDYF